jgi:tRNA (guanine26-N2/guanine27-N2)-dimethyltransferase
LLSEISEIIEGDTRILVPSASLTEKIPSKTPAFFNPVAKWNRDISVLAYKTFSTLKTRDYLSFADCLSGVGARGLRVGVEVPSVESVYMNDINPIALEFARKAAELNSIQGKCYFHRSEVCSFLQSNSQGSQKNRYDIVDLDPFGSPSPHLDCVLRAVNDRGMISITATDTAVLCGVYPKVCFRRYHGYPIRSEYTNEIGIRLLISLIAFTAARLDLNILPLFSHTNLHYMRTYVKISVSNSEANDLYSKIGYVIHCFNCGHREIWDVESNPRICKVCSSKCYIGGPLWKEPLNDRGFLESMVQLIPTLGVFQRTRSLRRSMDNLVSTGIEEVQEPYYFHTDHIASKLKTSPLALSEIVDTLKRVGFMASKASLSPQGFKTNASLSQILNTLKRS